MISQVDCLFIAFSAIQLLKAIFAHRFFANILIAQEMFFKISFWFSKRVPAQYCKQIYFTNNLISLKA